MNYNEYLCWIAMFLLFPYAIVAQTDFQKNQLVSSDYLIDDIWDLKPHDMDGDGDLDYLVSSEGYSTIKWLENDGTGQIAAVHSIDRTLVGKTVGAADLDGDNDLDVYSLVPISDSHKVYVWENIDGQGTFGAAQEIVFRNSRGNHIVAADIDEDGDMDLVADIGEAPFDFVWLENANGTGTVWTARDIAEQPEGFYFDSRFVVRDADYDGHLDIVTAYDDDDDQFGIRIFKGDGLGNFAPGVVLLSSNSRVRLVIMEDFNQDGIEDLLYFSSTSGDSGLFWSQNDGNGNFSSFNEIDSQYFVSSHIQIADVDDDGDNDIVYTLRKSFQIFQIINTDGNGNFGSSELIDQLEASNFVDNLLASDLDDNGYVDVVNAYFTGATYNLNLYKNDGTSYEDSQSLLQETSQTTQIIWADLDNDGDQDIIGVSESSSVYIMKHLDGNGSFGAPFNINTTLEPSRLLAVDLDLDNDLDLVVSSYNNNRIGFVLNTDGQGTMGEFIELDNNVRVFSGATILDIEGDGDPDILSLSNNAPIEMIYFENIDGQGNFSEGQIITGVPFGTFSVKTFDYDDDNDLDIFYLDNSNDNLYVLSNLGQGNFTSPELFLSGEAISGINLWDMADIDGDGILDLTGSISSANNPRELFWLKHLDGNGNFESNRKTISQENDFWIAVNHEAVDLDLDGDLDLVLQREYYLSWYENIDGNGAYGPIQNISWADQYRTLAINDITGDGRPDLLTGAYRSGEVSWFRNLDFLGGTDRSLIDLTIYPNPTQGIVSFGSTHKILQIDLRNLQGQWIGTWKDLDRIDLSRLPSGLYLAAIQFNNKLIQVKKILKY